MHDAGGWGDDAEVVERLLAPLEELVAFGVAVEVELVVDGQALGGAEVVDLHGVVDDEVAGDERVDLGRVAAELDDGVTHGCEVHDAGDAGEVLQNNAAGEEGDFDFADVFGVVVADGLHVFCGDGMAVEVAECGLEQDFDGVRQTIQITDAGLAFEGGEVPHRAVADGGAEGGFGVEGIDVVGGVGHGEGPWVRR